MKQLVNVSVKRPVGVIMLVIATLVLGAISLRNLAIDLLPNIEVPVAVVVTNYDGAAPQEMEQLITRPIEQVVGSIEGVKTLDSMSSPGTSLVLLQFDWGKKIDESLNDIRERIDQVAGMLPDDATTPRIIKIDPQAMPVMWLGVSGSSLENLQEVAEQEVLPFLERTDGVASVAIEGGKKREIQVELDPSRLALYQVSGAQVIQAIGMENRAASAGNLRRGSQDLQLRIDGEFTSLDDISNTLITLMDGRTIKVSDVATVTDTFRTTTQMAKVNGEDALVLTVMKKSDGNTVQTSTNVIKGLESLEDRLAASGASVNVLIDTADYIRDSIQSVVQNMLIGGFLAIAILFGFLKSVRTTLVIALSIPISIIATFTLMYFTGETVNILSMGGLALGIGMLLDTAIVILENIFSKREQGYSALEAAREGASELGPAVFAATTTTIVVFVPIVFVSGLASQIFRPLSYTVAFSLSASLIVSLTLIPMLASKMLGKVNVKNPLQSDKKQGLNYLRNIYQSVLEKALKFRKTTVAITFGLIVVSLSLVPFIGAEFIPEADSGEVQINLKLQTGAKLEETEAVVAEIDELIAEHRDIIKTNYVSIGTDGIGFGGNSNEATFMILLVPSSERNLSTQQFIIDMEKKVANIPGAEIEIATSDSFGMGTGSPVQVNINGKELDVLSDLSQQVVWMLEDMNSLANVKSTFNEGRPELAIVVKRDIASEYGLSYQQVMSELTLAFSGQVASRFRSEGNEFDVRVVLPEEHRQTIRDLEAMTIRSNRGVDVPLTAVADFSFRQGPAEINRSNQERQVRVTADLRGTDLGSVNAEIAEKIAKMNVPDGYRITTGGQADDMAEAFEQLTLALLLSIFLVYMVMAVQFESFLNPFIVMFSLPTSIIGVLIGLFVTGQTLNVISFIGLIMLSGIVVNNAIVLVDYTNILRSRGYDLYEAIMEAGLTRLRPILMMTLTTVLAMVPIFLGFGEGTEIQRPMAVVIIFGLMFSMVFTLVLIPVLYYMFNNKQKKHSFPNFLRVKKTKGEQLQEE